MAKRFSAQENNNLISKIFLSIAVWLAIVLIGATITAAMIGGEVLPPDAVGHIVVAILILASFAVTKILLSLNLLNPIIVATISAAVSFSMLLFGNWILCNKTIGLIPTMMTVAAGALCGLLIKRKSRAKSYGFRKSKLASCTKTARG